jgi:hypothetical protein
MVRDSSVTKMEKREGVESGRSGVLRNNVKLRIISISLFPIQGRGYAEYHPFQECYIVF